MPEYEPTEIERQAQEKRERQLAQAGLATDEEPHSADPKVRQRLAATRAQREQPLRQRPVAEDTVPLGTHEELIDPATGERSVIVETSHKPGWPLPERYPQVEPEQRREERETSEAVEAQVREQHPLPRTPSPAEVYAERDNIVHPGPTVAAAAADLATVREANFRVNALPREQVDASLVTPGEGETADEALFEALAAERERLA